MVNYHDHVVIAQDYCVSTFMAKHASSWSQLTSFDSDIIEALECCGWTLLVCPPCRSCPKFALIAYRIVRRFISSWEFVTTLDYEWSIFRRRRPFRWTIWIYFFTRIATLLAVVLFLVGTWGTGVIFQIQTIVRVRVRSIRKANCVVVNPEIANLNSLAGLTTDTILLLIMFFGLFRLHFHKSSTFGMRRLPWRQGLVWLSVALIADIIPMVFIWLNLNKPIDDIYLAPWVVALSIAATRIHRGLIDYASAGSTEHIHPVFDHSQSKANNRTEWKANRVPIMHTGLNRMEVAIPEMYKEDETPQISQHGSAGSFIDIEGQLYEKPAGQPRLDENVEDGHGVGSAAEISMT